MYGLVLNCNGCVVHVPNELPYPGSSDSGLLSTRTESLQRYLRNSFCLNLDAFGCFLQRESEGQFVSEEKHVNRKFYWSLYLFFLSTLIVIK